MLLVSVIMADRLTLRYTVPGPSRRGRQSHESMQAVSGVPLRILRKGGGSAAAVFDNQPGKHPSGCLPQRGRRRSGRRRSGRSRSGRR